MKISPCFTQTWFILGVYDFPFFQMNPISYIQNCPGSFKLYNDMGGW